MLMIESRALVWPPGPLVWKKSVPRTPPAITLVYCIQYTSTERQRDIIGTILRKHGADQQVPAGTKEKFYVWTVTSLLITRFFFPTPEMKARGHAVQKRYRNKESVEWLQKYFTIHSDGCSKKWSHLSVLPCSLFSPPGV